MSDAATTVVSYAALAAEYYDRNRHPTCANFRDASEQLLARLVPDAAPARSCEVGAGRSLLAELVARRGGEPRDLLLTDESPEMLAHSADWRGRGAVLSVAPAHRLPVRDRSLDLVVASLADPYDDGPFWSELARVLAPSGRAVVTAPSWKWASAFRSNGAARDAAEFELADGSRLSVPSLVRPVEAEVRLIEECGLRALEVRAAPRSALRGPLSPKLRVLAPEDPVAVGYVVAPGT